MAPATYDEFPFDQERFKRLAHYILWRSRDRDRFSMAQLYEALWFADARMFMLRGKPITGAVYVREKSGPSAKAGKAALTRLKQEGAVRPRKGRARVRGRGRLEVLSAPEISIFDQQELEAVEWSIQRVDRKTKGAAAAGEASQRTWELAVIGEKIPYHAILATRTRQPDEEEIEWARQRICERGLS